MTYSCLHQKKDCSKNTKGIATLNLVIILGLLLVAAMFLVESNGLVGKSYELRQYQKLFSSQEALIKKLAVKQTEQGSLANLQTIAKDLKLVVADKIKYLETIQSSVALVKNSKP